MKRLVASIFIAVTVSIIVFFVSNDFGITWDEPVYMRYGDQYVAWLKRPIVSDIDKFFMAREDDIHPPFRKLIAGLTHEILTTNLGVMDNTRGYRLSSLVFVFPFIFLFTYVAIGQFGYIIGMLTPMMFSLLPHVLFLTPLVTLDYAITAIWFVAIITAIKGMKSYVWLTISGLCIGLALLTKLHGYLLFLPVGGYWLWTFRKNIIPAVGKLVYIVCIAFAIYFIGWPWLWKLPLVHLGEYFRLQFIHGDISEYIFGRLYNGVPWWYTPVMFLATTPAFVLLLFAAGTYWTLKKGTVWDRFIFVNALYPIVFFSLPGVYRYDWVRLFLPAFPFVCLVAGRGMMQLKKSFRIFIIIAWLVTVYFSVVRIHPWESAYYNEFVGGVSGAARLGFESEFWGNAYVGVLPWMNDHKKSTMCVTPATSMFYYYQAMGQLSSGVIFDAGIPTCNYAIVLMRQGFILRDPFIASLLKKDRPVYTVSVDGVPLVAVYDIRNIK